MMQKYDVLIINYHFPPIISGGTQRVFNFQKYLPSYGVDTAVITTDSYGTLVNDKENRIYRFADRGYDYTHTSSNSKIRIFLFRAFRRIQVHMGFITDGKYYWKTEVIKGLDKLIGENDFDAVIASYPSPANLEIGACIHEKYGIPLIVDYRDGLMFEPFPSRWKSFILARARMESLEKRMGAISSLNLTVNQEMNDYYAKTYPNVKSVVIPNGFDDEEEIYALPLELPDGINVIYTGGIARSRLVYDFDTITKVLDHIFKAYEIVNYVFIGEYERREKLFFSNYNNVYVYPKTERQVILATQRCADALLLISGPKGGTSGKLYEYLFAQKPIMNIGGKMGIADIINGNNFGETFEPDECGGIKEFLTKLRNKTLHFEYPYMEIYTRRNQSKLLSEEIKKLLEKQENS